ncbi:MAG: AAA family ATPase [Spirochaetaceae bacterium]|nr:AAA family ATPase [Spirochaetaceae bacterium]
MITRLRLERFGAFEGRDLEFAAVTLFVGPNESGKTTIVDALCEVLCKPRSNRIAGKRLALRYGTDRRVSAEFDGEPMTLPEDAFGDLFAIRSGDLTLDVRPGTGWVEALKADLFTAGLDPKRLHAALARRAGTDGGSRHNRELRQLVEEQRRLEERRDLLLEQAAAARSAKAAVAERQAERGGLADELDGLMRTLDERQRHARRRLQQAEQREAERLLQGLEELTRGAGQRAGSAGEAPARLQELTAASEAAAQEVERARAELERARRHLQDGQGGAPGRAAGEAGRVRGIAAGVALGLLAGGVLAAAALVAGAPVVVAVAAGIAATAGTAAVAAMIRLRSAAVEAVREETDRAVDRLRARRERHDRSKRELRDFLERHGAESPEQLLMQLGGARADEARRRDAEAELMAAARERGLNDLHALAGALREQLRDPPHGPPAAGPVPSPAPGDEEALRARAAAVRERLDELDELVGREREKAAALSAGAGEMAEITARIAAAGRRAAALELDRRAAGIAASLFARIADESTAALDELSADIGARYAAVAGTAAPRNAPGHSSPATPVSPVTLAALEEEPLIVDASAVARPAGQLSQGTRDAYGLAARLALAERTQLARGGGDPGLLILDEPFQALDATRTARALRLIARFQEHTGFQLVVMTADERVALAVAGRFAGARVHRLAARGSGYPVSQ